MADLTGLHPTLMRPRVEALLADPEAKRHGVILVSGWRSTQHQIELWNAAVAKYGSEEKADDWVARPGTSRHETKSAATLVALGYTSDEVDSEPGAIAVDLGVAGLHAVGGQWPASVIAWFHPLAARHGLEQRMEWEDWHYEPIVGWKGHEEDGFVMDQEAKQAFAAVNLRLDSIGERLDKLEEGADKPLTPLIQHHYSKDEARPRSALARLYLDRFGSKK